MAAVDDTPLDQRPHLRKRRSSILEPPMMSNGSPLRVLVFGHSDHQQFSLTESILQRALFVGSDPQTILTTKNSGSSCDRNVTLINTPNLINHDLLHYTSKHELKKAVCFSCPGPHAVLCTLNPLDIPPNAYDIFKPIVQYFGESILNNTVIVLYHEEEQWRPSLEESVKKNKHFRELLEKCGNRCFFFSGKENRNEKNMVTKNLFEIIDTMVMEHGVFSNLEFKDADKRIQAEEKLIGNQRKKEISAVLEELEKTHSREDLEREVKQYEEAIQVENREKAEVRVADRLGFMLRLVDYAAAIGKGAFAGAVLAVAMGFPSTAIGAAAGAALGGLLGGAVGAAWSVVCKALADFRRNAN